MNKPNYLRKTDQVRLETTDFLKSVLSSASSVSTAAIPKALDEMWNIAMRGNMYRLTCSFGLLIAVIGVGFWCLKFYKALQEGTLQPAVNEMVFPLIIVIMLSNGGNNMRNVTMTVRDVLNGVNRSANTVIDADVSIRTAISVLTQGNAALAKISILFDLCDTTKPDDDYNRCMDQRSAMANLIIRETTKNWPTDASGGTTNRNPSWRKAIVARSAYLLSAAAKKEMEKKEDKNASTTSSSQPPVTTTPTPAPSASTPATSPPPSSPSPSPTPSPPTTIPVTGGEGGSLPVFTLNQDADLSGFEHIISSFAASYLYIVEVMMLITGLVGPVFLGLSMFPVATKPVIAWGVSFLSLGFCKICFTLISGLSAIAMVYAGPDQDMLVASVVLGLLAPVLSFGIASGSGLASLNSVGMISQNFGMNTGTAYGPMPGIPGGLPVKPPGG
jgi:hypothetical protein